MDMERDKLFGDTFLTTILNQMYSNIYITDTETDEILFMNKAMKQSFGLNEPEGHKCWQVLQSDMKERCGFCCVDHLKQRGAGESFVWRESNSVNGRSYQNYDSLIHWKGRTYHLQSSIDVTDYDQVSYSARMDELTGIFNRRGGNERLVRAMEQANRENRILTLVLYDINELKRVNDQYGHGPGAQLLCL